MDFKPLPTKQIERNVVFQWIITDAIAFLFVLFVWFGVLSAFEQSDGLLILLWYAGLFVLFAIVVNLILEPLDVRTWRYELREHELEISHGVIIKKRTLVPLQAVQHVDISQGIIERCFGLSSLEVSTAASTHKLPGLLPSVAASLRPTLIAQAGLDDNT